MFTECSLPYEEYIYVENSKSQKKIDFSWVFTERVTNCLAMNRIGYFRITVS